MTNLWLDAEATNPMNQRGYALVGAAGAEHNEAGIRLGLLRINQSTAVCVSHR